MAGRNRLLLLALLAATGCGNDLGALDVNSIYFNPDYMNEQDEREVIIAVRWANAGEPGGLFGGCEVVKNVEVTLGDVSFGRSVFGGEDEKFGACHASERVKMPRANAPPDPGEKVLRLGAGRGALEVTLRRPFELRHLTPTDPLVKITHGSTVRFQVESGEPLNVATAFLAPRGGSVGDSNRIHLETSLDDGALLVTVPDPYPWGNWQLFVAGRVDVVKSCPVDECTAGAVARASVSLTFSD